MGCNLSDLENISILQLFFSCSQISRNHHLLCYYVFAVPSHYELILGLRQIIVLFLSHYYFSLSVLVIKGNGHLFSHFDALQTLVSSVF